MNTLIGIMLVLMALVLFAVAAATIWWMLHAWRDPDTLAETGFAHGAGPPTLSFSLLVPARHEDAVLATTLNQLAALDYPRFEILAIIGHDDPDTAGVAEAAAARHPDRVRVVVDHNWPKNKPKALNTGLPMCRGEIVGVFDAEDEVHRGLLRAIDRAFRAYDADVVQGGVQLVNFRSSWFALRNCLEYFFWFRSRLHLQQKHGFVPLGGNTVFARTEVLRSVGGWDAECLAEDCDLGVRLSGLGARISVCYDPYLVTREETPDTVTGLLKQRTRWNQGFLQVLAKREWRRIPSWRQRMLARYTLCQPFLQAFAGIAIPIAFASVFVAHPPVGLSLLTFLSMATMIAMVVFELVGLREFCRLYHVRPRTSDYVRLLIGTGPYQMILAAAACRAVFRELRGLRGWEKTAHHGAHRDATATGGFSLVRAAQ